jgi:hypothetical protein
MINDLITVPGKDQPPEPPPAGPWVKPAGGDGYLTVNGVAVNEGGTIFATGNFVGAATFGRGERNEVTFHSDGMGGPLSGNADIFVAAYAPDGSLRWARHPSGILRAGQLLGRNSGIGVAVTGDGDAVVVGELDARLTFGAGEPNETVLAAVAGRDGFIARYHSDGTLAWAKRFGGGQQDTLALRVAAAPDGAFYVAGPFEGDVTFDTVALSGEGHAGEEPNAYLARFRGDGTLDWVRAVQGSGSHGWGVAASPDGSAVLVGDFFDSARLEGTELVSTARAEATAFIAKYSSTGALSWARSAGASGDTHSIAFSVAAATNGDLFVGGYFGSSSISLGDRPVGARGYSTALLAALDAQGQVKWVLGDGGPGGTFVEAVTLLKGGDVLLAGWAELEDPVELGDVNLSLYGGPRGHDAIASRYRADGTFVWATHAGGDGVTHANALATTTDGFLLAGLFSGGATFSEATSLSSAAGATDGFIAHYNVAGQDTQVP